MLNLPEPESAVPADQWHSFRDPGPDPYRRIRVKGYLRKDPRQARERSDVYVDLHRQFESYANVVDTHWQYMPTEG